MNYGTQMKKIRLENNLHQKDIANILDISAITYSHYETQDSIIPLKHLNTFCNYFQVSFDYIFNFTNNKAYDFKTLELNKEIIGNKIKKFRKEFGITQEKLAQELNIGKGTIADYERGRYLIATPFLYTICKKYPISADYLLGKIEENPKH